MQLIPPVEFGILFTTTGLSAGDQVYSSCYNKPAMIDIQEIPSDKINYDSPNIRSVIKDTQELADSMRSHGQLEPGTGWWADNQFQIATGHRRAMACMEIGIPFLARIIEEMSDSDLVEYQLVENVQAEALEAEDLENAVARLWTVYRDYAGVAQRVGKSPQWAARIVHAKQVRESLDRKTENGEAQLSGLSNEQPRMSSSAASGLSVLRDEENRKAAYDEAVRRSQGSETIPQKLIREVVDEFKEKEIRDIPAYIHKLRETRARLVKKRADIEAEIDVIDAKIERLSKQSG